jgi:hypothetical protein
MGWPAWESLLMSASRPERASRSYLCVSSIFGLSHGWSPACCSLGSNLGSNLRKTQRHPGATNPMNTGPEHPPLPRPSGCGPGGRGFEPHRSPLKKCLQIGYFWWFGQTAKLAPGYQWGTKLVDLGALADPLWLRAGQGQFFNSESSIRSRREQCRTLAARRRFSHCRSRSRQERSRRVW